MVGENITITIIIITIYLYIYIDRKGGFTMLHWLEQTSVFDAEETPGVVCMPFKLSVLFYSSCAP